jgi:hypothetical protein
VCLGNSREREDVADNKTELSRNDEDFADEDGYKKHFEAGVKVVHTNNECDILEGVKLDDGQEVRKVANV